jgi:NAD(P)-dependent dehydrogenase (short-subunit alcohol dehydrogenase family)
VAKLEGQVAFVTGAGRGIGAAIAQASAREGAKVALIARTISQLEQTAQEITAAGGSTIVIPADVTDIDAVEAAVAETERRLGDITLLINNAGVFRSVGPTWDTDPTEWWQEFTVNVLGVYLCSRQIIPRMLVRKHGRIINMIGGGADKPFPYGGAYGSSKAAVMRFTESLAAEVEKHHLKVFNLRPGFIRTEMSEWLSTHPEARRWLHVDQRFEREEDVPAEAAAALAVEIAAGRFDDLSGRAIRVVDDQAQIEANVDRIIRSDLYTLRMRDLSGEGELNDTVCRILNAIKRWFGR